MKVKNVEKKIFGDHKSLMGTSEIDSKYKYVKLARGLPTFGVHFFLVKVSSASNVSPIRVFSERGKYLVLVLTNAIKSLSYPLSRLSS